MVCIVYVHKRHCSEFWVKMVWLVYHVRWTRWDRGRSVYQISATSSNPPSRCPLTKQCRNASGHRVLLVKSTQGFKL